ncbi:MULTISPECIES: dTDP-4-dehydrorhamnose 3,5-epimerase [unclassified Bradyrhizobium]|uniref:dTDP-4-dehydrorhamnose 3,5-epimerase n=1 Tax=unclassified Bradyrhizobium TaxID=2631580 RepID=UPI002FF35EDB
MKFIETGFPGLFVVDINPVTDVRGFFARSFCVREFEKYGLDPAVAQCNISFNENAGTLRGLHYQAAPFEEAKLVRCTVGAIHDVVVDLRRESPRFLQSYAVELTAENRRMIFVPKGFAHGFQTLSDRSEVFYMMSEFYHPESARGLRWNDPALAIRWPLENPIMSEKDQAYPLLTDLEK